MTAHALICPECKGEIWNLPHGHKLAKCWACGLAFDTMEDDEPDELLTDDAPAVSIGDRVGYSARFLRSIAADYDTGARRGTVEGLETCSAGPVARIRWDDDAGEVSRALVVNVARVGSVRFTDPHARKPVTS